MKPSGVRIGIGPSGPTMSIPRITRTEDAIWNAVQEAVDEGWTVEQFRRECASAWAQKLRDEREHAQREWAR